MRGWQGGSPMRRPTPWGPSSPIKGTPPHFSLTPPREGSLSPSSIYPPWSRASEIHVPGGYSARKSCTSAASLEQGVLGASDVCASTDAPLICGAKDFLSILRSARDRLHQPLVWTR